MTPKAKFVVGKTAGHHLLVQIAQAAARGDLQEIKKAATKVEK
jgi:hypothetical protein